MKTPNSSRSLWEYKALQKQGVFLLFCWEMLPAWLSKIHADIHIISRVEYDSNSRSRLIFFFFLCHLRVTMVVIDNMWILNSPLSISSLLSMGRKLNTRRYIYIFVHYLRINNGDILINLPKSRLYPKMNLGILKSAYTTILEKHYYKVTCFWFC